MPLVRFRGATRRLTHRSYRHKLQGRLAKDPEAVQLRLGANLPQAAVGEQPRRRHADGQPQPHRSDVHVRGRRQQHVLGRLGGRSSPARRRRTVGPLHRFVRQFLRRCVEPGDAWVLAREQEAQGFFGLLPAARGTALGRICGRQPAMHRRS